MWTLLPVFESALSTFQQAIQTPQGNPLGVFLRGILERHNQLLQLREQANLQVQTAVETKKQTLQFEVEAERQKAKAQGQAMREALGGGGIAGATPTGFKDPSTGIDYSLPGAAQQKLVEATATNQAEKRDAAKLGVRAVSQLRGLLQADLDTRTIGNRAAIEYQTIPGLFLRKDTPDQRDLRTVQGKLHTMIAFSRTGRTGLEQQMPYVEGQYNIGKSDPDEALINRLLEAENELIQNGGLSPDEVEELRELGLLDEVRRRGGKL